MEQIPPRLATQCVADNKLDDIQRHIKYNTIEPDNTSPPPSNSFYPGKPPTSIYSDHSSHLNKGKPQFRSH